MMRAINVAGDVILVYRVDPSDGDLRVAYMNDAYTRQTGYSRDEAIGRPVKFFRQNMPDDQGMREVRAALAAGRPLHVQIVSYRKDGTSFWNDVTLYPVADDDQHITHWISVERDVTTLVEYEAAMEDEHRRLFSLTQTARSLFASLDSRSLIDTFRKSAEEILHARIEVYGISSDGRGRAIDDFDALDDAKTIVDPLIEHALRTRGHVVDDRHVRAAVAAGKHGSTSYAVVVQARNGRQLRETDLFALDLLAEYFSVAAHNVSLYRELEVRRSVVLELNQTKTDLIAMLAHDFRTPLTSIVGFADLVGEVGDVNDDQREFIATIKRTALQLNELAVDTLTLSRLERNEVSLQRETVDLAVLVRDLAYDFADRSVLDISVNGDATVIGDVPRLRQVFYNLVENGIKYSPGSTAVSVEIDGQTDHVVVRVQDRGIGIPAGDLQRIFERFQRGSNARKLGIGGTGFGLFLSKQLVALHGGTIEVESREGKGSTFTVTLPRRVTGRGDVALIALLDPVSDANSVLAHSLRDAGYRVSVAVDAAELLAMIEDLAHDAIVINVDPSALSTQNVGRLRALRAEHNVPLIVLTNEDSRRLVPSAVIERPVLIGDLVAALASLVVPHTATGS